MKELIRVFPGEVQRPKDGERKLTINPKPAAVLFADGRDAAREVGDEGMQISDASCLIDTVSWEDVTSLAAS
jgi:hypothetical protein